MPADEELIKAGAEGVVSGALAPFTELLVRLLGGACDEIGKGLTASVAGWSLKRQIRFWQREQQMISEAGFEPRAVPPKIVFTIVQSASIEDNDEMQDRWVALLSNAADPSCDKVLPAFPEILRQLTNVDALFLRKIYIRSLQTEPELRLMPNVGDPTEIEEWFYEIHGRKDRRNFEVSVKNIERLGLITTGLRFDDFMAKRAPSPSGNYHTLSLTTLGRYFIEACEPPTKSG